MQRSIRLPAWVALGACLLGLTFAAYSTYDYAQHLDRQLHAVHCSFIPGAPADTDADNPCRTALYSPYSSVYRESYWGGIPISLFALGAFSFLAGFALYLALSDDRAPKRARLFFGSVGLTPAIASAVMFVVSVTQLHSICKICAGIYISSLTLAVASAMILMRSSARSAQGTTPDDDRSTTVEPPTTRLVLWLVGLGAAALLPALIYVISLPDYRPYMGNCGTLAVEKEEHNALLHLTTTRPQVPVTIFEDPLCPTCKAFHERIVAEGIYDRLDVTSVMFPLDNECNWMLDRPLHAGACVLAKAVLCGGNRARDVLEWAYEKQDDLRLLGKTGTQPVRNQVEQRWGHDIGNCIDSKTTTGKLNQHLQYAVANHIPVSTPQMFLGKKRFCDEDTDLGLRYTFAQLAPEVLR